MSNVKVEKRKQEKYNRKKIEAAKKRKNVLVGVAALVVVIAIAAVLGVRIYDDYFRYDATADIDPNGISNAVSAVQQAGYEEPKEEDKKEESDKKDETDKKEEATDADKKDEATDADKKDDASDADKKDDAESDKKDDADKKDEE